ncbi:MAG: pantoate--beta-alanine ligase [Actinomycetota bacterium]
MKTFEQISDLRQDLAGLAGRGSEKSIGFVPTMGSLHEGHLALIRQAASNHEVVVVSIFVNPLQFAPSEDFESYPRDAERDKALAEKAGATHLFVPPTEQMYPKGEAATRIEVGRIGEVCEGKYRPGHFSGVATVCVKLFNIVQPKSAYFGIKDAQQIAVIRQVVNDLNIPIEIVLRPTVRSASGLALSSRNQRLNKAQASAATVLSKALFAAANLASKGEHSVRALVDHSKELIEAEPAVTLQYLEIVDPATFEPQNEITPGSLMVLAAQVGPVRLIDNIELVPKG